MFGFIKPETKELKVKEHELYKSVYCGLCRVMGKRYSYLYKMSLSYDFVFFVLLRLYTCPETVSFSKKRCIAHPAKKKTMMDKNNALEIASDVGVIMLYHDFIDKIRDKDGIKSFLCRLTLPELKRLRKKACKNPYILEFDKCAEEYLKTLFEYEQSSEKSVDMPADIFGKLLGDALSVGLDGNNKRIIFEIGKHLGRWIYIIDAIADLDKDIKKKKYNPFLASYNCVDEIKSHGDTIQSALTKDLFDAYQSLILIDNSDENIFNILENIISIGNINTQNTILKKNNFSFSINN